MTNHLGKGIRVATTVALLALSVGGCTKKATMVEEGNRLGVLHRGNGTEPADLDPQIVTGVPEHHIIVALFEGLVSPNPKDLTPEPGVAESWTVSPDQKTYTFKIRANAKWSNGDAFTAQDFVYSWNRVLSPGLASEYAYMLYPVENAEAFNAGKIKDFAQVGVRALDPQTLQVRLKAPTPYFLQLLAHYSTFPVHKATIEKHGAMDARGTKWTRPENMVSNGPFTLKQWDLNKIIRVEKNPLYWDAQTVALNGIHFYPTDSQQTEERKFRAGELHVTNEVPLNKIEVYRKENPELIRVTPYLGTYYYRMNVTKKPLDNVKVRQALVMAIDRKQIVERVTKGGQIPAESFTPPGTAGYTAAARIEYNPEKARQLLAEAGYPGGKGMPPVEILFNTSEAHKVIAEAVQQMLKKELGIDVQLANQDWKVYLSSQKTLNYGISRAGWIGDYVDPNNFLDMWVTGGGNNQTGWSNARYDALIKEASMTGDSAKRFAAFQEAEKILLTELPVIPIYTYTRVYLIRPEVQGWEGNILDAHPYKYIRLGAPAKVAQAAAETATKTN
jgi:oligopeptide transport system substrate-binding protein